MDRIELHDVEYGDCSVLVGRNQSILMVDCGSVSEYTRRDQIAMDARFEAIFRRYAAAASRNFLLTHYHRDHMSGFLKKLRNDPNYFDLIYIPAIPFYEQKCPLLEIALFSWYFSAPQSDFAQVNTTCLSIFEQLRTTVGTARIQTLRAGDVFLFDGVRYTVLSPDVSGFLYDEKLFETTAELNRLLMPFSDAAAFLRLKSVFLHLYMQCQAAFSPASRMTKAEREAILLKLSSVWHDLESLRGTLEHLPVIEQIQKQLYEIRTLYTETQNSVSLVFHNVRDRAGGMDVLFAGDTTPDTFDRLASKLYSSYYAVKAPHHGTESHWSDVFSSMEIGHVLISNGEYHAGGSVSGRYIAMESMKHCSNPSACPYMTENSSCCNRLLRCYEQSISGALTLKCAAAAGNRRTPCNIYVFGHNAVYGCYCDRVMR